MGYSLNGAVGRPGRGVQWFRMLQRLFLDEAQPAPEWASLTLPAPADATADGSCVLVVDDNPVNLMLASEMLLSFGLTPMLAADGAEAVAMAREVRLDLILMDLQMPVLDGFTATQQIRRMECEHRRARVPVVAYTSSAPGLRVLLGAGIDDVLDKPCDRAELQACIERWCPELSSATTGTMAATAATAAPAAPANEAVMWAPHRFHAVRLGAMARQRQGQGS